MSRPPPSNLDTEAVVLSACMLHRDSVDIVADVLKPEHMWSEANRFIYQAILELAERGDPVDPATVAGHLRNQDRLHVVGGAVYIAQLIDATPAVHNVETHARMVRDLWRLRQVIAECQDIAARGYRAVGDIQGFLDEAEVKIRAVTEPDRASSMVMLRDSITKVFGDMSASMKAGHASQAVKTGLHKYDEATTGLHPGDLLVLAGRPGMGKTSAATAKIVNIAAATEHPGVTPYRNHVALFELEMPHDQIATRMACSEASVEVQKVRAGSLSMDDMRALTEAAQFLSALPIHIDDTGGITPVAVRAKCRRIASEAEAKGERLAAVVIDHIGIMNCKGMAGRNGSRSDEIGAATSFFKTMAKEMKLPIILLCQLNRAVEKQSDKRPGLADLRDSGNIEQDADNVTFVFREEYYVQAGKTAPDEIKGVAELIIAKQRNGPTGVIKVKFDGRYTRFENMPEAAHW
jgi:replicative DNA helicase